MVNSPHKLVSVQHKPLDLLCFNKKVSTVANGHNSQNAQNRNVSPETWTNDLRLPSESTGFCQHPAASPLRCTVSIRTNTASALRKSPREERGGKERHTCRCPSTPPLWLHHCTELLPLLGASVLITGGAPHRATCSGHFQEAGVGAEHSTILAWYPTQGHLVTPRNQCMSEGQAPSRHAWCH